MADQTSHENENTFAEVLAQAQVTGVSGGIDPELLPYLEDYQGEEQLTAVPGKPLPIINGTGEGSDLLAPEDSGAAARLREVLETSVLGGPDPTVWQSLNDPSLEADSDFFDQDAAWCEPGGEAATTVTVSDDEGTATGLGGPLAGADNDVENDRLRQELQVCEIYEQIIARTPEHQIKPTKARIRQALDWLANPQLEYPSVHITGTNGKTSTARMIDQLLQEMGLRVGRFTSPHLITVRERISIDGQPIEPAAFIQAARDVDPIIKMVDQQNTVSDADGEAADQNVLGRLSFFEYFTAMAFQAFASAPVDWAVVEVGMGGRWDATNVLDSPVQVLTPISLDHEKYLGNTVAEIAAEKVGIFQPNATVISGPQPAAAREVIIRAAAEKNCLLRWVEPLSEQVAAVADSLDSGFGQRAGDEYFADSVLDSVAGDLDFDNEGAASSDRIFGGQNTIAVTKQQLAVDGQVITVRTPAASYEDIYLPLHGSHQAVNAATALAAVEAINGGRALPAELVEAAFAKVTSPGRCQVVRRSPTVLVDAAHNPGGARALRQTLEQCFRFRRLVGVFSAMADKAVEAVLGELEPVLEAIVVTPLPGERAMALTDLAKIAVNVFGEDRVYASSNLAEAVDQAATLAEAEVDPSDTVGVVAFGSVVLAGQVLELCQKFSGK